MRIVWLLGGDVHDKQNLEQALNARSSASEFYVRLASAISDIPEVDILSDGVTVICNAFHPD